MQSQSNRDLEYLFNPRSIALAGISTTNTGHWTRGFLESLIEFKFPWPIYLVNRNRGNVEGFEVYPDLLSIPGTVDYVISTVPAREAPKLVE